MDGLYRELWEELRFKPRSDEYFLEFTFNTSNIGIPSHCRIFYIINASDEEINNFVLYEGSDMRFFTAKEVFSSNKMITPYDSYAIWLHMNQHLSLL